MKKKHKAIETNQWFYDAFNKSDLELMKRVWLDDDPNVQCVHPGWDSLTGFEPIIESWKRIFSAGQDLEIKLSHLGITESESLVWITCQENLFSISSSGVQLSKVYATNIFKKVQDKWKMILHHASPVSGLPSAEEITSN